MNELSFHNNTSSGTEDGGLSSVSRRVSCNMVSLSVNRGREILCQNPHVDFPKKLAQDYAIIHKEFKKNRHTILRAMYLVLHGPVPTKTNPSH